MVSDDEMGLPVAHPRREEDGGPRSDRGSVLAITRSVLAHTLTAPADLRWFVAIAPLARTLQHAVAKGATMFGLLRRICGSDPLQIGVNVENELLAG